MEEDQNIQCLWNPTRLTAKSFFGEYQVLKWFDWVHHDYTMTFFVGHYCIHFSLHFAIRFKSGSFSSRFNGLSKVLMRCIRLISLSSYGTYIFVYPSCLRWFSTLDFEILSLSANWCVVWHRSDSNNVSISSPWTSTGLPERSESLTSKSTHRDFANQFWLPNF